MNPFVVIYVDKADVWTPAENHTALRVVDTIKPGNPGTTFVLPSDPIDRVNALDRLIEAAQHVRRVSLIKAGIDPDHLHAGGQNADTAHTG